MERLLTVWERVEVALIGDESDRVSVEPPTSAHGSIFAFATIVTDAATGFVGLFWVTGLETCATSMRSGDAVLLL